MTSPMKPGGRRRSEESKYTFVFVASVNIVHPLWACRDVTRGRRGLHVLLL